MAIKVNTPDTVGREAHDLYNLTVGDGLGQKVIEEFAEIINLLTSHWTGSDAKANITDLGTVYGEVAGLMQKVHNLVKEVNNREIYPLQQNINDCGGHCDVAGILEEEFVVAKIELPTEETISWVDNEIINDAKRFSIFPDKFSEFVNELDLAKSKLLDNWQAGGNRDVVDSAFAQFKQNVKGYEDLLERVKANLNIVAANKEQLL